MGVYVGERERKGYHAYNSSATAVVRKADLKDKHLKKFWNIITQVGSDPIGHRGLTNEKKQRTI